jgi:hypothetical protein
MEPEKTKRFTDAEILAVLWHTRFINQAAMRYSSLGAPGKLDRERVATLIRFAKLPHYDETGDGN